VGQKVRPLHSLANVFQMPELICMIFSTLQYSLVLNTSVDFIFIISVIQSSTVWP